MKKDDIEELVGEKASAAIQSCLDQTRSRQIRWEKDGSGCYKAESNSIYGRSATYIYSTEILISGPVGKMRRAFRRAAPDKFDELREVVVSQVEGRV